MNTTLSNGEFRISTDRSEMDVLVIHRFLSEQSMEHELNELNRFKRVFFLK